MTLLTAIIMGIGTGLLIRNRRRRLWVTGLAVAVMLPLQSWGLPLIKKPHFSLSDPGYWGVQPVILLLGLLLTLGVGHLRHRIGSTPKRWESTAQTEPSSHSHD